MEKKYRVYYTNHMYYAQDEFATVEAALSYGKARGFEFSIHGPSGIVGVWSVFGGYREF